MPLGDWGFKTRLMDWKLLRVLEIGLAVLKADNPPQGMNGTRMDMTKDTRDTTVVDMIEGITGLIILIMDIEGIAIEIMVMVPTSIDLTNTPRRHLYIPGSPRMYMRIRRFQQQI